MPYLICNNCNIYYKIDPDFNTNELQNCEECGGKLKLYGSMAEYYENMSEEASYNKKNETKTSKTKKITAYNLSAIFGLIIAIIGLSLVSLRMTIESSSSEENFVNVGMMEKEIKSIINKLTKLMA